MNNKEHLINYYNKISNKNIKINSVREKAIDKAFSLNYKIEEIEKAILGCLNYETFIDKKYKTLEYILRINNKTNNIDRFSKLVKDSNIIKVEKKINEIIYEKNKFTKIKKYTEEQKRFLSIKLKNHYNKLYNITAYNNMQEKDLNFLSDLLEKYDYDLLKRTLYCYYRLNDYNNDFFLLENIFFINENSSKEETKNNIIEFGINKFKINYFCADYRRIERILKDYKKNT